MLRVGKPAAVVQELVEVQQEEVRGGTSTESGVAAATGDKGKRKDASLDELEPDGGMVIREKPGDELRRASEVRRSLLRFAELLAGFMLLTLAHARAEHTPRFQAVKTTQGGAAVVSRRESPRFAFPFASHANDLPSCPRKTSLLYRSWCVLLSATRSSLH